MRVMVARRSKMQKDKASAPPCARILSARAGVPLLSEKKYYPPLSSLQA